MRVPGLSMEMHEARSLASPLALGLVVLGVIGIATTVYMVVTQDPARCTVDAITGSGQNVLRLQAQRAAKNDWIRQARPLRPSAILDPSVAPSPGPVVASCSGLGLSSCTYTAKACW